MILPTKRIEADSALLSVGADIVVAMESGSSVSAIWSRVRQLRAIRGATTPLTYDWFVLALTMLNALGLVVLEGGTLRRVSR